MVKLKTLHVILIIVFATIYLYLMFRTPRWKIHTCPLIYGQDDFAGSVYSEVFEEEQILSPKKGYRVDCTAVMKGNEATLKELQEYRKCHAKVITNELYIKLTKHCDSFKTARGYSYPVTQEEKYFPIAFSILTYENVEQTERLLRAIYRPQNYYCIHVDVNSQYSVRSALSGIAGCFENVFLASHPIAVQWSEFSVLQAELQCLKDLVKYPKWKYFINLTGREFPLRTNWELVQILKAYNGSNDIDGTLHRRPIVWTKYVWRNQNWMTWKEKAPPPSSFLIAKGSTHIIATRPFIEYVIHNKSARDLLEWMRDIRAPDEHYFPTLNHNPHLGIPGSYTGDPDLKMFLARFKIWQNDEETCDGVWWRFICNLGVGDISRLTSAKQLFANKFRLEFDSLAFTCAEQWYLNRTRNFEETRKDFKVEYYSNQPWVKKHV